MRGAATQAMLQRIVEERQQSRCLRASSICHHIYGTGHLFSGAERIGAHANAAIGKTAVQTGRFSERSPQMQGRTAIHALRIVACIGYWLLVPAAFYVVRFIPKIPTDSWSGPIEVILSIACIVAVLWSYTIVDSRLKRTEYRPAR